MLKKAILSTRFWPLMTDISGGSSFPGFPTGKVKTIVYFSKENGKARFMAARKVLQFIYTRVPNIYDLFRRYSLL